MPYKTFTKDISLETKKRLDFITITGQVEDIIKESGVKNGSVIVQSHHTTFRIWVNEDEKNLVGSEEIGYDHDLKRILDRFAGPDEEYRHNDICDARNPSGQRNTHLCAPDENGICHECVNGHAHAQALILPHAVTMIVKDGKLLRGTWQEIMSVELDHDRSRKITVLVQGSTQ